MKKERNGRDKSSHSPSLVTSLVVDSLSIPVRWILSWVLERQTDMKYLYKCGAEWVELQRCLCESLISDYNYTSCNACRCVGQWCDGLSAGGATWRSLWLMPQQRIFLCLSLPVCVCVSVSVCMGLGLFPGLHPGYDYLAWKTIPDLNPNPNPKNKK